jgi:hypothetical protein
MKHERRNAMTAVALVAALAFAGLALLELKQAMAGCGVTWDLNQQTCLVADENGDFSDSLTTSVTSLNQIPWTLYMAYTPGGSPGIASGTPLPAISETICTSDPGCEGGDAAGCATGVTRTITGTLEHTDEPGTFEFSVWDGTYWQCSDAFEISIQPLGGEC